MNTNNDIVLAAHGVAKTYHETGVETPVFSGIDFAVRAGEAIAIMGASGAGKSTLLHLLGGLDVPDCGEITVAGQRMNALSDSARGRLRNEALGFVYQFHHLLPEFTALENVAMPLLIRGLSVAAARAAAQDSLIGRPASPWPTTERSTWWRGSTVASSASLATGSSSANGVAKPIGGSVTEPPSPWPVTEQST